MSLANPRKTLVTFSTTRLAKALLVLTLGLPFAAPLDAQQPSTSASSAASPAARPAAESPDRKSGEQSTPAANSAEANQGAKDENEAFRHSPSVVKLGAMLGMSPDAAAVTFEILNFAVLALLVGGFLLKALPKAFRNRTTVIQKHLVDARTATEEASARMNAIEERLGQLDGQISGMRAQAEKDLLADEARMKAAVEEEKARILAAAEHEIAAATMHAQRQLQQYAAELAIEQAAKKLVVNAETDRLLVQNFARRLGGDESKGGQN